MIHLTADEHCLLKELSMFIEPVEISDGNGKLLGLFVPANLERGKQRYAEAGARIDAAEIERRKQSKEKGYTTKEVFEHLKSLTPDAEMQTYLQRLIEEIAERDKCASP
jgi:hypothetical protein